MVTRAAHCVLFWALLLILQGAGTLATPSTRSCPLYVQENGNLTCMCTGLCSGGVQPTFSWQQGTSTVSQNASLVKTSVKREDNGTRFTCQMMCSGESNSTVYVLQVSYGPTSEHLTIRDSGSVVVGANKSLVLACLATEVNPTPTYTWNTNPCNGIPGNECTFIPQREHDAQEVTCKATSADPKSGVTAFKPFIIDLKFPPSDPPLTQGYTEGEILINGSVLTCRVNGGKPLVKAVNFSCDGHPDQPDSTEQSSMISSLTINSSRITDESTRCVCTATWPTQPDLYLLSKTLTIKTQYKAVVKNVTLNDTGPFLEVVDDNVSIVLTCNASGMPLPDIRLFNRSDGTLKNVTGSNSVSYTVHRVSIEDMGTYKCTAGNAYGTSDSRVQLLVRSLPQSVDTSNSKDNSTLMTEGGLNFTVLMYPNPHPFNYTFYGRGGNQTRQAIPADMFNGTYVREKSSSPVVVCSIKPLQSITEEKLGVYDVLVANDLGNYTYYFEINKTIQIGPDPRQNWVIPVAVVLSIVAVLAVVAAVVIVKRKAVRRHKVNNDGITSIKGNNHHGKKGSALTSASTSNSGAGEYRRITIKRLLCDDCTTVDKTKGGKKKKSQDQKTSAKDHKEKDVTTTNIHSDKMVPNGDSDREDFKTQACGLDPDGYATADDPMVKAVRAMNNSPGYAKVDATKAHKAGACLTMGRPSGKAIVEYTTPYPVGKQQTNSTTRSTVSSAPRTPRVDSSGYAITNDILPAAVRDRDGQGGETYDILHTKIVSQPHNREYDHLSFEMQL